MCIRDRMTIDQHIRGIHRLVQPRFGAIRRPDIAIVQDECCLLYTSDAADERSSVDLGGRRIIKKKHKSITASMETIDI